MHPVASIPSPSQGVWHLGFVPIRAYALMIIIGIVVAVWLGEKRWAAKGGTPGVVIDVAVWAVPFGLLGGRLYHVVTDYQRYFGAGRDPLDAVKIWEGGLGIWGAVLLGGVGALIGCRRHGVSVAALGDAVAPGIALAQGIGRWGNYWNQELYGRPLDAFWALEIDPVNRPRLDDQSLDPKYADVATYHPTFLYEFLWCIGVAVVVIWAGKRFNLTHGRTFALYLAGYTVGRFWIELLRIDDAHHILGMRLNNWTAIVVFLGAVAYIYWARNKTGPENVIAATAHEPAVPAGTGSGESEAEAGTADKGGETKADLTKAAGDTEDGKPESKPESEPESKPDPEPETTSESEDGPGAEGGTTTGTDSAGGDEPGTEPAPGSTTESDAEPEDGTASRAEGAAGAETEDDPGERPESADGENESADTARDAEDAGKAEDGGKADTAGKAEDGVGEGKGEPVKDGK